MLDHEDRLGDGATLWGENFVHSPGDLSTFGDTKLKDALFEVGMKLHDRSERFTEEGVFGKAPRSRPHIWFRDRLSTSMLSSF